MLSDAQIILRRTGIGSSEASAILGISPWVRPIDVWRAKVCPGDPQDRDSEQTSLGHRIEGLIVGMAAERLRLSPAQRVSETVSHPSNPILLATPDAYLIDGRVLEAKNVGWRLVDHWRGDAIPDYVYAQVQHQMHVLGHGSCFVAALIGGRDLQTYEVAADSQYQAGAARLLTEWWNRHVVGGVEPDIDGSRSYRDYLSSKFPSAVAPLKPSTEVAEVAAEQLKKLKASEARLKKAIDLCSNALRKEIGDHAGVETSHGTVRLTDRKGSPRYRAVIDSLLAEGQVAKDKLDALVEDSRGGNTRVLSLPRSWTKGDE